MITKIVLHNFQCHKDLTLDLGRSTVLQGNSNSGKTAVLRALYWVLYNTPSGDSYVSYWAKAKTKFKVNEYTSVIVEIDGHVIERKRSNDFNGYIVDGTVFEALRTSVPDEVTKIFNLADASVQRQMDAPFLLSSTPGESSQYLNSLAGLECVDELLAIAKRKVADTAAQVETTVGSSEAYEKEMKSYHWVSPAEDILSKVTSLESVIADRSAKASSLRQSIAVYKTIKNYPSIPGWLETADRSDMILDLEDNLKVIRNYVEVCRVLFRVSPRLDKINSLKFPNPPEYTDKELSSLSKSICEYRIASRVSSLSGNVLSQVDCLKLPAPCKWAGRLDALSKLNTDYYVAYSTYNKALQAIDSLSIFKVPKPCKWTDKEFSTLIRSIRMFNALGNTIEDLESRIKDTYSDIDGMVCPVCGRPMDKDTCVL